MDDPKNSLPAWLPWAATACLAALVACLGELLIIEKTKAQVLSDQVQLTEAAMRGMENQLEAERIVSRRELATLRPTADVRTGLRVALLSRPPGAPGHAERPDRGAVVWDPAEGRGLVSLSGSSGQAQDRDYQLWLEGPGEHYPANCGAFHADAAEGVFAVEVASPVAPGCRFVLVEGPSGGAATLPEALAGGPIVLATPPFSGKK
jgi:hypothetical protein